MSTHVPIEIISVAESGRVSIHEPDDSDKEHKDPKYDIDDEEKYVCANAVRFLQFEISLESHRIE